MLLSAMVFQLGACPCGCIEHNAWVQFLGLDAGDHDHTSVADHGTGLSSISSTDTHDCTGEGNAPFVDNARGPCLIVSPLPESANQFLAGAIAPFDSLFGLRACHIDARPIPDFDAARIRPSLQVYQL